MDTNITLKQTKENWVRKIVKGTRERERGHKKKNLLARLMLRFWVDWRRTDRRFPTGHVIASMPTRSDKHGSHTSSAKQCKRLPYYYRCTSPHTCCSVLCCCSAACKYAIIHMVSSNTKKIFQHTHRKQNTPVPRLRHGHAAHLLWRHRVAQPPALVVFGVVPALPSAGLCRLHVEVRWRPYTFFFIISPLQTVQ